MHNDESVVTLRGHTLVPIQTALVAGSNYVGYINISPLNISSRIGAVSDSFMLYRFTKMFARYLRPNSSSTLAVMGYTPSTTINTPANVADVAEFQSTATCWPGQTVPCSFNVLRHGMDANPLKWLKTRAVGAVDDNFEYQGSIYYAEISSAVATVWASIDYEVQFKGPVPTSVTVTGQIVPTHPSWVELDEVETKSQRGDVARPASLSYAAVVKKGPASKALG